MRTQRHWKSGLILAFLAGGAATLLLGQSRNEPQPHDIRPAAANPAEGVRMGDRGRRITPIVEVVQASKDAVVNIGTRRTERMVRPRALEYFNFGGPPVSERQVNSVGSGFVVHESGLIVTNAHVAAQGSEWQVFFADNRVLPADLIAADMEHDLAVLKVDSPTPLRSLPLGHSADLMIGETVIAIGNPLGLQHTVTTGIVSALNRELKFAPNRTYNGLIQTDAAINPGNSGGPLLNINGELIGINTAIRGDAQNVGFAIPVDRLWELLPQMLDIERHERIKFGLSVSGTDSRVTAVMPGSPAQAAELQPGDKVISLNGRTLRDGIDYYASLRAMKAGDQARLLIDRAGSKFSRSVPLVPIPPPDGAKLAVELLGLQLGEIPDRIRGEFELSDRIKLWVDGVVAGSPAARAGFEKGDLILQLNRVPVSTLGEVGLILEQVRRDERVPVEMARVLVERPFRDTVALRAGG